MAAAINPCCGDAKPYQAITLQKTAANNTREKNWP